MGGDGDVWADTMADEKMRIYSAHDTTVVSLLASMHLLHNTSFWLLPPYATVMTMEMRMTDSGTYTLGWRIGYPRLAQGMVWDKWEMHDETLDMPCPDDTVVDRGATVALAPTCPVGAFLRYVLIMTDPMYDSRGAEYRAALPTAESTATELLAFLPLFPPTPLYTYPANDGCCVPPADLLTRCPTWQAYEDASGACQLMRRLCPDVACGAGLTVAVGSFGCVRAEQMSVADSVKDAVIVVCSLVIALLFRRRRRAVGDAAPPSHARATTRSASAAACPVWVTRALSGRPHPLLLTRCVVRWRRAEQRCGPLSTWRGVDCRGVRGRGGRGGARWARRRRQRSSR